MSRPFGFILILSLLIAIAASVPMPAANAAPGCPPLITEGFAGVSSLFTSGGWVRINNSQPIGPSMWTQGIPPPIGGFDAQSGPVNSFMIVDFESASFAGTISNWALTPVIPLHDGAQLKFYTRTLEDSFFPDRMQVRMSTAGASTNVGTTAASVGDFTSLLLDINPTLAVNGYPHTAWQEFIVTVTGVPTATTGRFAFRYFVTDGGPEGTNSNLIAIDTLEYDAGCSVPLVSGNITYQNAAAPPAAVPGVTLTAGDKPSIIATTDANGGYTMTGFAPSTPYTVTPSRAAMQSGAPNGIFANDAALISRHVVGLTTLNADQQLAAAVSGGPALSSFDAALIARWIVGLSGGVNQTGQWKFTPVNRSYSKISTTLTEQNYTALLMGDVSGDWTPSPLRPFGSPLRISAPLVAADVGSLVTIPLRFDDLGGEEVTSYQFEIGYDPTVLTPADAAATLEGTLGRRLTLVYNAARPGLIRAAVFGAQGASGDGVYLELKFKAAGPSGSSSPVTISAARLNNGERPVTTAAGRVTIR